MPVYLPSPSAGFLQRGRQPFTAAQLLPWQVPGTTKLFPTSANGLPTASPQKGNLQRQRTLGGVDKKMKQNGVPEVNFFSHGAGDVTRIGTRRAPCLVCLIAAARTTDSGCGASCPTLPVTARPRIWSQYGGRRIPETPQCPDSDLFWILDTAWDMPGKSRQGYTNDH